MHTAGSRSMRLPRSSSSLTERLDEYGWRSCGSASYGDDGINSGSDYTPTSQHVCHGDAAPMSYLSTYQQAIVRLLKVSCNFRTLDISAFGWPTCRPRTL